MILKILKIPRGPSMRLRLHAHLTVVILMLLRTSWTSEQNRPQRHIGSATASTCRASSKALKVTILLMSRSGILSTTQYAGKS